MKYEKELETLKKLTLEKKSNEIKTFLENIKGSTKKKGDIFEEFLCLLYKGNGFLAVRVGRKDDLGADVLLYDPRTPERVSFIIQAKNQKSPLSFDNTKSELSKFEDKASVFYNCENYILISVNGFVSNAYDLTGNGMKLKLWTYVEELIESYDSNGKSVPRIEFMEHNEIAYSNLLEKWKESNLAAIVQPTGTGKSVIISQVLSDFINERKIVLAPSDIIINQIKKHAPWLHDSVDYMTYAKLIHLSDKQINDLNPFLIVLDEFHRAGADEWGKSVKRLLEVHEGAKVLGTSATPIRYLDSNRNMTDELFDGNLAHELTLAESIIQGTSPNPIYVSSIYTLNEELVRIEEKIKNSKNEKKEKSKLLGEIKKFQMSWERSSGIPSLLNKYLRHDDGKFIVFCKDINHLEEMDWLVRSWFQKSNIKKKVETYPVISEEKALSKRNMEAFRKAKKDKKIHLMFAIDMLNEGIHMDDLDGVFLLRPTSSPILYIQQIGRANKTGMDKPPLIFDLVNNFSEIRSRDIFENFEKTKKNINEKRRKNDLREKSIEFTIFDETKDAVLVFQEIEKRLDNNWDLRHKQLIQYKEKYGDCLVPKGFIDNPQLARWVKRQRTDFKTGTLDNDKVQKLIELNFEWDVLKFLWNKKYEELKKYKRKYSDCIVPSTSKENRELATWVANQRSYFKNGVLDIDKIQSLNELGFDWEPFKTLWNKKYEELKEYKQKHGDCLIPKYFNENLQLANWVINQRTDFKNGVLDIDKIQKLNELGFEWDAFKSIWNKKYEELKEYKRKHGDCLVPQRFKENHQLAIWVGVQRKNFKIGTLSNDNMQKLNDLGFDWNPYETLWSERYEELKKYKRKHGDCLVPKGFIDNPQLAMWVGVQRKNFKKGKLDNEKIQKLNELGFIWTFRQK